MGMRGGLYGPGDYDEAREMGFTLLPWDDLAQFGTQAVAAAVERAGGKAFLTFDIDFVDPAFAPGTGTPEVGGPSSMQALALLRACRGLDLVGADVVEVLPDLDSSHLTATLAATVANEILALVAVLRVSGAQASRADNRSRVACVQLNDGRRQGRERGPARELVGRAAAARRPPDRAPRDLGLQGRQRRHPGQRRAARRARATPCSPAWPPSIGVYVLAGSLYETAPAPDRVYNTSALFGPDGRLVAAYRKIHLFDAVSAGLAVS